MCEEKWAKEFLDPQKWDSYFMGLARYISTASKDPSTKVGAVIVDQDRRVVSTGYNGFPRGVVDTEERLNDRDTKLKIIVHAERNAIIFARQDLRGCKLYVHPFMCCTVCAGMVIQSGITEVIAPKNDSPRWQADFQLTKIMFQEAGVMLRLLDI